MCLISGIRKKKDTQKNKNQKKKECQSVWSHRLAHNLYKFSFRADDRTIQLYKARFILNLFVCICFH